jgi:endonuclease/exonuclease/phosphatase family metal-dependent hydrolase
MLSKWPVCDVETVRLPDGNEPRVALVVTMQLPDGRRIRAVSLHFDWVADDTFRLAQANALLKWLRAKEPRLPTIVMGDFNDQPKSAVLAAFREDFVEAKKPLGASFTWPADGSKTEIDYIFFDKSSAWKDLSAEVVTGKIASDHCPVVADAVLGNK